MLIFIRDHIMFRDYATFVKNFKTIDELNWYVGKHIIVMLPNIFDCSKIKDSIDQEKVFERSKRTIQANYYIVNSLKKKKRFVYVLYENNGFSVYDMRDKDFDIATNELIIKNHKKAFMLNESNRKLISDNLSITFDYFNVSKSDKEEVCSAILNNVDFDAGFGIFNNKRLIANNTSFVISFNLNIDDDNKRLFRTIFDGGEGMLLTYKIEVYFNDDYSILNTKVCLINCYNQTIVKMTLENENLVILVNFNGWSKESFNKSYNKSSLKQGLYELLKYVGYNYAKWSEVLPELYIPSAYHPEQFDVNKWDDRLLVQEMIEY